MANGKRRSSGGSVRERIEERKGEHLRHPKQYILTASMMGNILNVVVAVVGCHLACWFARASGSY